ncbi:MAG: hypothetical protein U5K00_00565 [Melioribacteraceae bacterium]|nr:hypothetical protein [Melioribacteraceae bacterium]
MQLLIVRVQGCAHPTMWIILHGSGDEEGTEYVPNPNDPRIAYSDAIQHQYLQALTIDVPAGTYNAITGFNRWYYINW